MIEIAHKYHVPVLIDAAQSIPHMPVDVLDLDCDFLAFSGHKVYGPTGVGVLYGKKSLLENMAPYQGGGSMIRTVAFDKTTYAEIPQRFEAGTPNITGAIGLHAAIQYIQKIGLEKIVKHEAMLTEYTQQALSHFPGLTIIGNALKKTSVFSFIMDSIHPHDIGTILNVEGIAVRSGHHCAMPLMKRYQVPATVRVSLSLYNTQAEIDELIKGLHKVQEVLGK